MSKGGSPAAPKRRDLQLMYWDRPPGEQDLPGLLQALATAGFGALGLALGRQIGGRAVGAPWLSLWPRLAAEAVAQGVDVWAGIDGDAIDASWGCAPQLILRIREQDARDPLPKEGREETLAFLLRREGPLMKESTFIPVTGRRASSGPGTTVLLIDQLESTLLPAAYGLEGTGSPSPDLIVALQTAVGQMLRPGSPHAAAQGLRGIWLSRGGGHQEKEIDWWLPWAPGLAAEVQRRHGIDILARMPELVLRRPNGRHQEARWAYYETLTARCLQGLTSKLASWCDRQGIRLAGTLGHERSLASQTRWVGAAMRHLEAMHDPWVRADPDDSPLALVQAASVARITGRAATALGADDGSSLHSVADQRWRAELAMVLGVERRADGRQAYLRRNLGRGVAQMAQQALGHQHHLREHLAALENLLAPLEPVGEIGLLHPIESAWAVYSPADKAPVEALDHDLELILRTLLDHHRQVDLIDEEQLSSIGIIATEEGKPVLRLGAVAVRALVIPPLARLRGGTRITIERFLEMGGPVVVVRRGGHALWSVDPDAAALLADRRVRPIPATGVDDLLPGALADVLPIELRIRAPHHSSMPAPVWARRCRIQNREVIYLVSRLRDRAQPLHVQSSEDLVHWGREAEVLPRVGEESLLILPPAGSAVLVPASVAGGLTARPALCSHRPALPRLVERREQDLGEPQETQLEGISVWPLDRARWRVGPEELSIAGSTRDAERAIRLHSEYALAAASRPEGFVEEAAEFVVAYQFTLPDPPPGPIGLAWEATKRLRVEVNGTPLLAGEPAFELDGLSLPAIDLRRMLRAGKNSLVARGTLDPAFRLEVPRLLGPFAVFPPATLGLRPTLLLAADACEQGLAFHHGDLIYRWRLSGPCGNQGVLLELAPEDQPAGSFAGRVDQHPVGEVAWPPYLLDLGSSLRDPGPHWLEIRVLGHQGNIFARRGSTNGLAPVGLLTPPRLVFTA